MNIVTTLSLLALAVGTAHAAEHFAAAGQPPICAVGDDGRTHVFYNPTQHASFKCSIDGASSGCMPGGGTTAKDLDYAPRCKGLGTDESECNSYAPHCRVGTWTARLA